MEIVKIVVGFVGFIAIVRCIVWIIVSGYVKAKGHEKFWKVLIGKCLF